MFKWLSSHKVQVFFNLFAIVCCFALSYYTLTSDRILVPLVQSALLIGGQTQVRIMAEGVAFVIALVGACSYLAIFFLQVIRRDMRLEK